MRTAFMIRLGRAPQSCDGCDVLIAPHAEAWVASAGLYHSEKCAIEHEPSPQPPAVDAEQAA